MQSFSHAVNVTETEVDGNKQSMTEGRDSSVVSILSVSKTHCLYEARKKFLFLLKKKIQDTKK